MEFVTDRTETDVLLKTQKGCYGIQDLNRVEETVEQLCALAARLDIHPGLTVKTDWGLPGVFSPAQWATQEQMERYLDNVRRLCEAVEMKAGLPVSMEQLTWEGANQIEQALLSVYSRIQNILQTFQFSGEFFAGEEDYL